jgi:hypothetical protein
MFAAVCDALHLLLGVQQPRHSPYTAFLIRFLGFSIPNSSFVIRRFLNAALLLF